MKERESDRIEREEGTGISSRRLALLHQSSPPQSLANCGKHNNIKELQDLNNPMRCSTFITFHFAAIRILIVYQSRFVSDIFLDTSQSKSKLSHSGRRTCDNHERCHYYIISKLSKPFLRMHQQHALTTAWNSELFRTHNKLPETSQTGSSTMYNKKWKGHCVR